MSAVEGAEGGEWAQAGLWARGWHAVALREERGEEDGGGTRGRRARRDWLGTSDGPIDDEPSRRAVWHKWLRRAGGACAFLSPSISIHSSLPDLRPSHARKRCLRSFKRVIIFKSGCHFGIDKASSHC